MKKHTTYWIEHFKQDNEFGHLRFKLLEDENGYAIKSTIYLFRNELGESEQQRKQRKILEYIAKRGGKVKRATLLCSRVLGGGAKDYDYVLDFLWNAGLIEVDKSAANKTDWICVLTHTKK